MSDTLVAKGTKSTFTPHPEGQFLAQCVDTIDMGEKVEQYQGQPPKIVHKCVLMFRTGEQNAEGNFIDIGKEFTVSMGDKANLRKALEQWRGKKYTEKDITEGVPLHKLTGQWALITIEHKLSAGGNTYGVINAMVGVPRQMKDNLPTFAKYERPSYYAERKAEYTAEVAKLRPSRPAGGDFNPNADFEDFPGALNDEDDDLPF
jgi:hypothetical protein